MCVRRVGVDLRSLVNNAHCHVENYYCSTMTLSIYVPPTHFSDEFLSSSPINPSIYLNPSENSKKEKKKKRDLIRKSEGMERSNSTSGAASGFHGYHQQRLLTKSSSSPGMMISTTSTNKPILEDNSVDSTACTVREQDRFMPIANVIRIMRKVLPTHAKISDDAKETIQECVSEYISFVTSEANDRCQREQRKTITAEDVLWAMNKLGFDDYIEPLSLYLRRYREFEGDRVSIRGDPLVRRTMDLSNTGYVPAFQMGQHHQQGLYGAPTGGVGVGGGYYRDNGSNVNGNQNQTPLASYDPFAPRN